LRAGPADGTCAHATPTDPKALTKRKELDVYKALTDAGLPSSTRYTCHSRDVALTARQGMPSLTL
jgi:hypothetical protein